MFFLFSPDSLESESLHLQFLWGLRSYSGRALSARPELHAGGSRSSHFLPEPPLPLSNTMKQTLRLLNYSPLIKFVGGPHSHGM